MDNSIYQISDCFLLEWNKEKYLFVLRFDLGVSTLTGYIDFAKLSCRSPLVAIK